MRAKLIQIFVYFFFVLQNLPIITTQSADTVSITSNPNSTGHVINMDDNNKDSSNNKTGDNATFTTMTPQEIAMWIDRRSRFLFPLMFLGFNCLYWTFVYCF